MQTAPTYTDVIFAKFDAGVYREYITDAHGDVLTYGGSGNAYARAMRHAKALAKVSKVDLMTVIADIQKDVEARG